jgi:DNA-binding response OmpR family regulator
MPRPVCPTPAILVVEDDPDIRAMTCEVLRQVGYRVVPVATHEAAHAALHATRVALVLADTADAGTSAHDHWATLDALRAAAVPAPVVIFTAHSPERFADHAARGFAGLLAKPFDLDELLGMVRCMVRGVSAV